MQVNRNLPKDNLIGILIGISRGIMPKLSTSNEWRSIFSTLINNQIIEINLNCDDVVNNLIKNGKGKLIPKKTVSRSRQWININLNDVIKNLKIKINDHQIDVILDNFIKNFLNNDISIKQELKKYFDKIIKIVINNSKSNLFIKINAISNNNTEDLNRASYREIIFYELLTNKLIFPQHIPNIASFIASTECPYSNAFELNRLILENNQSLGDYFKNEIGSNFYGYKILVTENMANSQELVTYLDKFGRTNDSLGFFLPFFFQLTYTLENFRRMEFIHYDLHHRNIMIEELKNPKDYYFVILDNNSIKKVVNLRTIYFMRIFDFDHSFSLDDIPGIPDTKDLLWSFDFRFVKPNDYLKFDFVYILLWVLHFYKSKENFAVFNNVNTLIFEYINYIFYKNANTVNSYPSKKLVPWQLGRQPINLGGQYIRDILNNCMTTKEFLDYFITIPNSQYFENCGIIFYDDLSEIPLTNKSEIFFPYDSNEASHDKNISKMRGNIFKNPYWQRLNIYEKLLVCSPIVWKYEIKKNIADYPLISSGLTNKIEGLSDIIRKYNNTKSNFEFLKSSGNLQITKFEDEEIFDIINIKGSLISMIEKMMINQDNAYEKMNI